MDAMPDTIALRAAGTVIHPTAIVAPGAKLGVGVLIGHDTVSSSGGPSQRTGGSTTSTGGNHGKSAASGSGVDNATGKAYLQKALSNHGAVSVK